MWWSAWPFHHTLMPVAGSRRRCSHERHRATTRETASGWKYHSMHHFADLPVTLRTYVGSSCSWRNSSAEP